MNFLKKYLTFHICALFGYYCLWQFIADLLAHSKVIKPIGLLNGDNGTFAVVFTISLMFFILFFVCFILMFSLETLIRFWINKVSKKNFSTNIQNKYYDIFFYIGLILIAIFILPGAFNFLAFAIAILCHFNPL